MLTQALESRAGGEDGGDGLQLAFHSVRRAVGSGCL